MTRAALAICVVLAWALARRVPSPRQRAIAAALTGLLAIDVVRPWLALGSDLDVAAFALWYAVTAGAVWSVLRKDESPGRHTRGPLPVCWSSALTLLALVAVASPIAYRHGVDVARVAFSLALAAQLLAALRFAFRGKSPDSTQVVALILAASALADAFGPWLFAAPDRDWSLGRWISVVTFSVISGVQLWRLQRRTGS